MRSLMKLNRNGNSSEFPQFPSLFDDFLMRDFFNLPGRRITASHTIPAVNITESDAVFDLAVAAPGMDKKDFKIELEKDMLIISAQQEVKEEEKSEDQRYTRQEFSYHSFKRAFHLPEKLVNHEAISATYKDGILHIVIPKKELEKTKVSREITIA